MTSAASASVSLTPEQRKWLKILGIALVEIRALGDDDASKARDLADLMHNVPSALFCGEDVWGREKRRILAQADRCGLGSWLDQLLSPAGRT